MPAEVIEQQPETSTAIAVRENAPIEVRHKPYAPLAPRNMAEALKFAEYMAGSDLVPKDYKGKPGNVLVAIQMGAEVGLTPMVSLKNIAVINGRASLWGDAALAVVMKHPQYEEHKEFFEGTGENKVAVFRIKRRRQEWYETRFSVQQAKLAGLWNKEGTWRNYPDRMLQMRARGFGMRDKFPDALSGLYVAEEALDMTPDNSRVVEAGGTEQQIDDSAINCERCKGQITETTATKNGQTRTVSVRDLTNRSKEMWGKNICADCQRAIAKGASVEPPKDDPPQQQSAAPAFETKFEPVPDSGGLVEVVGIPVKFEGLEVGNRKKLVITMSDGYGLQTWHTGNSTKNRLNLAISKAEPTLFQCQETEKGGTKYLDMKDVIRVGDKTIEQLELNTTLVP